MSSSCVRGDNNERMKQGKTRRRKKENGKRGHLPRILYPALDFSFFFLRFLFVSPAPFSIDRDPFFYRTWIITIITRQRHVDKFCTILRDSVLRYDYTIHIRILHIHTYIYYIYDIQWFFYIWKRRENKMHLPDTPRYMVIIQGLKNETRASSSVSRFVRVMTNSTRLYVNWPISLIADKWMKKKRKNGDIWRNKRLKCQKKGWEAGARVRKHKCSSLYRHQGWLVKDKPSMFRWYSIKDSPLLLFFPFFFSFFFHCSIDTMIILYLYKFMRSACSFDSLALNVL